MEDNTSEERYDPYANGDRCDNCDVEFADAGTGKRRCCGCCRGKCGICAEGVEAPARKGEGDEGIECCDCGVSFILTAKEKQWFQSKSLLLPRRCYACRQARKAERQRYEK